MDWHLFVLTVVLRGNCQPRLAPKGILPPSKPVDPINGWRTFPPWTKPDGVNASRYNLSVVSQPIIPAGSGQNHGVIKYKEALLRASHTYSIIPHYTMFLGGCQVFFCNFLSKILTLITFECLQCNRKFFTQRFLNFFRHLSNFILCIISSS